MNLGEYSFCSCYFTPMRVSFAYIYTHDNDDINGSINASPDKVAHCMHKIIDMQLMTNNLDHIKLSVKKGFLTYSAAQTGQLNILDECKALFSSMFTA